MFIRKSTRGYYRGTEQHSGRGEYLILFGFNKFKAGEESGRPWNELSEPKYASGKAKLWAAVRMCSLVQCGHWMMGTVRIGGKSLTVSGEVGSDGLPDDIQDVPEKYRSQLVEVPEEIATAYWGSDGHNEVGKARGVLMAWALETFKARKGGRA